VQEIHHEDKGVDESTKEFPTLSGFSKNSITTQSKGISSEKQLSKNYSQPVFC